TCAGYGDIAGGPQCVVAAIPAAAVEIHPITPKLDDHRRGSQMYVAAMNAGGAELKYVGQRLGAGAGQTFGVLCTTDNPGARINSHFRQIQYERVDSGGDDDIAVVRPRDDGTAHPGNNRACSCG